MEVQTKYKEIPPDTAVTMFDLEDVYEQIMKIRAKTNKEPTKIVVTMPRMLLYGIPIEWKNPDIQEERNERE